MMLNPDSTKPSGLTPAEEKFYSSLAGVINMAMADGIDVGVIIQSLVQSSHGMLLMAAGIDKDAAVKRSEKALPSIMKLMAVLSSE